MNLAEIKTSSIPKRKLFQIERAIVRESVNLWFDEKAYFSSNFADDVNVEFKGRRIEVTFSNKGNMHHGAPEATVNEMMRGLILTMVTNQKTGKLVKNHEAIIGNILDVFVHRLKERWQRKFIFKRLQSLELGFDIAFGLGPDFYPIKKARHYLEEALTVISRSTPEETIDSLLHDMLETETLVARERGVTFHIFMAKAGEASFISLPLGVEQSAYVPLLGTHTLRCNIIAELEGRRTIKSGILKLDAPSDPIKFIRHKGIRLDLDVQALMSKLGSVDKLSLNDFSKEEKVFLKLLFNEYVMLAHFLLSSDRVAPDLRLLVIFPRINIYRILHEENPDVPSDEPMTLSELAALHRLLFKVKKSAYRKKQKKSQRIPESVIQGKVYETITGLARYTLQNIYKPLSDIKRNLTYYTQKSYDDRKTLETIKTKVDMVSLYLKKFNSIKRVVFERNGQDLDLEQSMTEPDPAKKMDALEEIVQNIQASEIEQVKDVIISKMLDYLSFITVRLEQLNRVSSTYIKQEVVKEMDSFTSTILLQAQSYYKMVQGGARTKRGDQERSGG